MENTEILDSFMSRTLGSPSGTVYEKFKPFEIVINLFQFLSDLLTL